LVCAWLPLVFCFATDGRTNFLQERAEVGASPSSGFLLYDGQTDEFSSGKSRGRNLSFLWFFTLRRTNERVFFRKEQRSKPLVPLVFCFVLGTKQNIGFVTTGLQAWADCVRSSQVRTSLAKSSHARLLTNQLHKFGEKRKKTLVILTNFAHCWEKFAKFLTSEN
jgi:hypothetical protein